MVVWSYLSTMVIDPGRVPHGWHPFDLDDLEHGAAVPSNQIQLSSSPPPPPPTSSFVRMDDAMAEELLRRFRELSSSNGTRGAHQRLSGEESVVWEVERPRWCRKCKEWKPPRTHHCSVSRRCVLRMDHYCVWVANTVGLLNYKAFVLFLGWALLGCLMTAVMLIRPVIRFFSAIDPSMRPLVTSFLAFVFTAAFSVALAGFLVMHLRLVALNMTTIEAYEKSPVRPWPYDRGAKANFLEVFGKNHLLWVVPIASVGERRKLLSEALDVAMPLPFPPTPSWQPEREGHGRSRGSEASLLSLEISQKDANTSRML